MMDWMTSIQNTMRTTPSVRVSAFTMATETEAHRRCQRPQLSGIDVPASGRTITHTPISPSTMAATFHRFIRSPRNSTARTAVQIGMVNSMATTCASVIRFSATNQAYCAP